MCVCVCVCVWVRACVLVRAYLLANAAHKKPSEPAPANMPLELTPPDLMRRQAPRPRRSAQAPFDHYGSGRGASPLMLLALKYQWRFVPALRRRAAGALQGVREARGAGEAYRRFAGAPQPPGVF